jgi:hypothetical protein
LKTFKVVETVVISRMITVLAETETEAIEKAQEVNGEDWVDEGWDDPEYNVYEEPPTEIIPKITP